MKNFPCTIFATLATCLRVVSGSTATVYVYDPPREAFQSSTRTLSPFAARCVIAQRAGVLEYHASDLTGGHGNEAIAAINDYGLSTPLTGAGRRRRSATILVEGVDDHNSIIPPPPPPDSLAFLIDQAPSVSASRNLLIDFAKQADQRIFDGLSDDDAIKMLLSDSGKTALGDSFHIAQNPHDFSQLLSHLFEKEYHVTAVFSPNNSVDEHYGWGTYEMPDYRSNLQTEKLLETDDESLKDAQLVRSHSKRTSVVRVASSEDALPGILPSCFASQSACESMTKNCTGHGQCIQRFKDESYPLSTTCYSCQCSVTIAKNAMGRTKTTYWGGPACQKRDVSSSFWLLALFTVSMIFLVSFAVGQIWSMGEEELPSVIGAGVSGPVKRS